jgi:hypothetical protein
MTLMGEFARFMLNSFRIPSNKITVGVLNTVLPPGSRIFSAASFVSSSPLRMARFSYGLVTGSLADVIPLAIRLQRDKGDTLATREILQVLTNNLYESRDRYENLITRSLLQGCSGLSLIMGYTSPWAVLLRKQCEASAVAIQVIHRALFCAQLFDQLANLVV